MNIEYYYRKLFSADRRQSLVFSHIQDNELCLKYWESIGGKFVVENRLLANRMSIDSTNRKGRAERLLEKAIASGELVFGIKAICFLWPMSFRFSEDLNEPEEKHGCKGLNFIVIDKEKFLKVFPGCEYCQEYVFKKLREKEDYFQSSLNRSVTEVLFRGEGLKTEIVGTFAHDDQAYEEVIKKFPYICYDEDDFLIDRWKLKPDVA